MISVSDEYKQAIGATTRQTFGKTVFEIVDTTAKSDETTTATSESPISDITQLYNDVRDTTVKYATLETDFWKVDGTFNLPTNPMPSNVEIGYMSEEISDSSNTFSIPQVLTIDFSIDHSSIGLTLTFDVLNNQYATDFTIQYYDSSMVLLHEEIVTNNTSSIYILEQNVSNYRHIVLTFNKTNQTIRRLRIVEIDFGIIETYENNELISMSLVEELDTLSNEVIANEFKFSIENKDKRFNILNPTGIYPFLQRKQKILAYNGLKRADDIIEYVPLGIFYLTEWKSETGTFVTTFVARDILDVLNQSDFVEKSYTATSLYDIAVDVLGDVGITDYSIDTALQSIIVTATLPTATHKEQLQTIALAGQSVCYVNRYGTIIIKQLNSTPTGEIIDFNNIYQTPQIKLDKLINTVNVKYGANTYTYVDPDKPVNEPSVAVDVDNALIDTLTLAQNVATWILEEYKNRFLYSINWRQNPALEVGDIVVVEDDFGENKLSRIIKQEINYAGYLSGKTETKGGE